MIWRKHYRSMYEGSMIGAGAAAFAVMGYTIAHQEFDRRSESWVVRLNPILLSAILGETPDVIKKAIDYLCSEDKNSGTPDEGGKRLVSSSEGSMEYRVVNGQKYQEVRDYEDRKLQNREAQARFRKKKNEVNGNGAPRVIESANVISIKNQNELKRVENRITEIRGKKGPTGYDNPKLLEELKVLKVRQDELKKALGFSV